MADLTRPAPGVSPRALAGAVSESVQKPAVPRRRLVSRREAAAYLGLSEWSVKTLHWEGHLPVVRLPGCRRALYDLEDLADLIAKHKAR